MNRSFEELIGDYESSPMDWEIVHTTREPSTNRRNRGGESVEELFRHKVTGEEMVRHTVLKSNGSIFAEPHFRPVRKASGA